MKGGHQIKNPAYVDGVLPVGNKTEVKNLVVKASQVSALQFKNDIRHQHIIHDLHTTAHTAHNTYKLRIA